MKNKQAIAKYVIVFLALFSMAPGFASNQVTSDKSEEPGNDSIRYIEIIGSVTHKRVELPGSAIKVYLGEELIVDQYLGSKGIFIIHLEVEKLFLVEISNPDYHSKVFRLATHMWNSQEEIYPVEMFVDLFAISELKKMKKPEQFTDIKTLYYNSRLGYFENNEPRSFALKERFKVLKARIQNQRMAAKKQQKQRLKKNQIKQLKLRPDRLSKYNS